MAPSQALIDFRSSLGLATSLLRLEKAYTDPPAAQIADSAFGLRGGAAVLMVATFERFVRHAAQEHFQSLRDRLPRVVFDRLPDHIRVASAFTSLERAMAGPEFGKKNKRVDRLRDMRIVARDLSNGVVNAGAVGQTSGNPGPETIKRIMKYFEILDPFTTMQPRFEQYWKSSVATLFIENKLQEIIDRRNEVAHTGDVSRVARSDLHESMRFLRCLANTMDDELRIKVNKVYRRAKGSPGQLQII